MPLKTLNTNTEGDLSKKNIFELEEMLARLRALVSNSSFTQKLPDKGMKLNEKVGKVEQELVARKLAAQTSTDVRKNRTEVEKLEWNLQSFASSSTIVHNNISPLPLRVMDSPIIDRRAGLDSDDDTSSENEEEEAEDDEVDEVEMTFKMLATSQVSQHQPKVTVPGRPRSRGQDCPLYIKMLANTVEHKSNRDRFVPNRSTSSSSSPSARNKGSPSPDPSFVSCQSSPARSVASSKDDFETCSSASESDYGKSTKKWDDSLLTPKTSFGSVQSLTLEQSFQLNNEKFETLKDIQSVKPKKVYAHEALIKTGKYDSVKLRAIVQKTQRRSMLKIENHEEDLEFSDELTDSDDFDSDDESDSNDSDEEKNSEALSKLVNDQLTIG